MHLRNWTKISLSKSLFGLLLLVCVLNVQADEEKIISIDCKDKRNQTVSLEIDLNSNQFKATKKIRLLRRVR